MVLMVGIMARPSGTARLPVYESVSEGGRRRGREGGRVGTGGQKSFCMSTIMRAAVLGLKDGIVVVMSGVSDDDDGSAGRK
jgi:hypothetical protein